MTCWSDGYGYQVEADSAGDFTFNDNGTITGNGIGLAGYWSQIEGIPGLYNGATIPYAPSNFDPNDPSYQLASAVARDTKDATQLLDCTVNGVTTILPGANKLAGAPSYPGLPVGSLITWMVKGAAKQFPELAPLAEKASPYLWTLTAANAIVTTKQCLSGSSSKAMGLGGN